MRSVQGDNEITGDVVLATSTQADIVVGEAGVGEATLFEDVDVAASATRDLLVAASRLAVRGCLSREGERQREQGDKGRGETHDWILYVDYWLGCFACRGMKGMK